MKRAWLVAAWIAATAGVSFVTFQTLSFAEAGIGEASLAPVVVASTGTTPDTGEAVDAPTGTTPRSSSTVRTTVPTISTSTTQAGAVTSTTSASTPSTTVPPPATPTTVTTTAAWETRTVPSPGGSVTVRLVPGVVEFVSAIPAAGFTMDLDDAGPERVRVEFASEAARYEVRIEWNSGELRITTG